MKLQWLGHACFLIAGGHTSILTDPCDPGTGYALNGIRAELVTVSHGHHDHNYLAACEGAPAVIEGAGVHAAGDAAVTGYPSFHDPEQGRLRGPNTMFLIELDGLRILHAGDLGAMPDDTVLDALGRVDVLLVPVGGRFTVDAEGAYAFVRRVNPGLTVPMHYQTPALSFALAGVEPFLRLFEQTTVERVPGASAELTRDGLTGGVLVFEQYGA